MHGLDHAPKPVSAGKRREPIGFPHTSIVPGSRIASRRPEDDFSAPLSWNTFALSSLSEANPGRLRPKEREQLLLTQAARDRETAESLGQNRAA